ncbi:MAG: pilus assembly protein TadG-related protein [Syntrophomonadales bacterium]
MNMLARFIKNEDGTALVLVAVLMVGLMGCAALVIDVGAMYSTKAELQNAADAAALAAARRLPNIGAAITTAEYYAELNGVEEYEITATTPYDGDSTKIEVVCTRNVPYTFARVLGFTDIDISARAVAKHYSQWAGEALPFINLDDDYEKDREIVAWEKTTPGDFESINDYEIFYPDDPELCYFLVDYMNGVELKKGTVATIKQEVGYVYNQHYPDKPVYVLSLSSAAMNSGQVMLIDGSYRSLSGLKNGDVVHPSQLVLLECTFDNYDYSQKSLYLTVLKVYDIANNEFPPDYVSPEGGTSRLVG